MSRVVLDLSVSLDGYAAGPGTSAAHPLGEGGEPLHQWLFGIDGRLPSPEDRAAGDRVLSTASAFVMGRLMFDVGAPLWGPDGAFGKPCFVVTSRRKEPLRRGPTTFRFVTDGVEAALAQAKEAARGGDVCVVGGPSVARQFIAADLLDAMHLHLVPVILGQGNRLIDGIARTDRYRVKAVVQTELASHLHLERAAWGRQRS